ncbi:hypothetical protein J2Z62_000120 [Mycoplasmoides fastidiosum]|uniref:Lipoprotein n=1 Tax=Mycoplasmoides fastidiosum TaxID=92758 RepID=A0ABU0LY94_9BACT|nr:hypothetical protein [Mycoplasmoides fastidiosum]MDQ0513682.1 hypothetical protein [Mycoplasmoides fastidiosum]UUD37899.1 hypothetical protein NPA10_00680 [Mycoplasmoides fastidiosum]
MKKINLFKTSQLWLTSLGLGFISSLILSACATQTPTQKSENNTESSQPNSASKSKSSPDTNTDSKNDKNYQSDQSNNKTDPKSDTKAPFFPKATKEQITKTETLVNSKEFQHLLEYENRGNRDRIFSFFFDTLSLQDIFNADDTIQNVLPYFNIQKPKFNFPILVKHTESTKITTISSLIDQLKSKINSVFTKEENRVQKSSFQSYFEELNTNIQNLIQKITNFVNDGSKEDLRNKQDKFISNIHKYLTITPEASEKSLIQVLQDQENYLNQVRLLADKLLFIEKSIIDLQVTLKKIKDFQTNNNDLFTNNSEDNGFINDLQNFLNTLENQVLLLNNKTQTHVDNDVIYFGNSLLERIQKILHDYKKITNELQETVQIITFNKNLLINNSEAINLLALNIDTILDSDVVSLKKVNSDQNNKKLYDILTTTTQSQNSFQIITEAIKKLADADKQNKLENELHEFKNKWEKFKKILWEVDNKQKTTYPFVNLAKQLDEAIEQSSTYRDVLKVSALINEIRSRYFQITNFVSTKENSFANFDGTDYFSIPSENPKPEDVTTIPEFKTFMEKLDALIKQEGSQTQTSDSFSFTKLKTELVKLQNDGWEFKTDNFTSLSEVVISINKLSKYNLLMQKNKLNLELAKKFNYGKQ